MSRFASGLLLSIVLLFGSQAAGAAAKAKKGSGSAAAPNAASDYAWVKNAAPLKGGLKTFKVGHVSAAPIEVYRLWDSKGASATPPRAKEFGSYWAAVSYSPEAAAREKLAVCWEFNHMDRLITCTLQPNAVVAYGPGQNVKCADGSVLGGGPQQIVIANAADLVKKGALRCSKSTQTGFTGRGFAPGAGNGSRKKK
jgi:hypothetical protein